MCLVFVAWRAHPRWPLVVAANRDEYHARPTAPAHWWAEHPDLLAGRDLEAGGTWMGVARGGRFAAVTNYREPTARGAAVRSRGELVRSFLAGDAPVVEHLRAVVEGGEAYAGFSLLAIDGVHLGWCSNRRPGVERLAPGVYGLSNHLLDTPWPKVEGGKQALAALLAAGEMGSPDLFGLLDDPTPAPDDRLPDTGVGRERERWLSPRRIVGEHYGTRSSTVVMVGVDGHGTFTERRYDPAGVPVGESSWLLEVPALAADGVGVA